METAVAEAADPLARQMAHFLQVCQGLEAPLCTGEDGLRALEIIEAIRQAAAAGAPVAVAAAAAPGPGH